MREKNVIVVSWGSLWRIFSFALFAAVLFTAYEIFLVLFLALVISSGIEGIVTLLERRGIPRMPGVILIFLIGFALLIGLLYALVPLIIIDVNQILANATLQDTPFGIGALLDAKSIKSLNELVGRISRSFIDDGLSPIEVISRVLGGVGLVISIFVISFYLALTKEGVERFIRAVFPSELEGIALRIFDRSQKKIGFWFRTQIVLSVIVGVLVWSALTLLGVPHALILGFIAAIFEIVPYVGPFIAGGAAVVSALTISVPLAVYTTIAFLAIQQLESHILVPLLIKRSVGLHPVIVIVALLVGFKFAGFLGALVSVPAAAVLQEAVEEWSLNKRLSR